MEEEILINDSKEFITLNEFLKLANIISTGGQAKWYLQENEVYINDELENRRGRKLYPGMKVRVEGSTFLINKR
ncbi:MAG: S4 domain-containing protein YaaA [Erysipelotrichaceae bacterium]|jgi:ribosome-associated protein|nr:S4 domain-containing protein YaaA [Erysipelotrichaceae bacterium]